MKRIYKIALALLVALLIIALIFIIKSKAKKSVQVETGFATEDELLSFLRKQTVKITCGEKHASGIIYEINDDSVILLTAGHLCGDYEQGIIEFSTGNAGFGDIEVVTETPDMAILSFSREYLEESILVNLRDSKVSLDEFDKLSLEDEVWLMGSSVSVANNTTKCRVASKDFYVDEFDARMLYLYGDVFPGMSGCGVFNNDGYLIGILVGGTEGGEAVCVPLSQIIQVMEEYKNDKN